MFWNMTKNEVLNLLKYFDLNEKSGYISFLFVFFFYFICLEAENFPRGCKQSKYIRLLAAPREVLRLPKKGFGKHLQTKNITWHSVSHTDTVH